MNTLITLGSFIPFGVLTNLIPLRLDAYIEYYNQSFDRTF
jgi:hypothetical protein